MLHRRSSHAAAKLIYSTTDIIFYSRALISKPDTPLATVKHGLNWCCICSTNVTAGLCLTTCSIGADMGFLTKYISACVIRTGGSTPPILDVVDYNKIKLLGK